MSSDVELPRTWVRTTVEELAEPKGIAYGVLKPGPRTPNGVPMLRVTDVRGGLVDTSHLYKISHQLDYEFRRTKLRGGEVVVSIQGSVGRAAVISADLAGANVSRTLAVVRLSDPQLAPWLHRALETPSLQAAMRDVVGGTTRDSLNLRDLRRLRVPVAPEPDRAAILATVESAINFTKSSTAHLGAARRAVARFRQAVLAAASSGRLTADWREQHANQTPVSLMLGFDHHQLTTKRERAVRDFDTSTLPAIPITWAWVPLAAVSDGVLGKMLDKAKNKGELRPYLRNINVRWRGFDLDDLQQMRFEPGEGDRYGLQPGDVLVCEGGEPGRAAVWREPSSDMRFQKAIHRVRCERHLLPDWLVEVLQAHAASGVLSGYFTGTGIAHLTGVSLARVPIPLPPVDEQVELVRIVDSLWSFAEEVSRRIERAERKVDRSSQAILAKAFRGELMTITRGNADG